MVGTSAPPLMDVRLRLPYICKDSYSTDPNRLVGAILLFFLKVGTLSSELALPDTFLPRLGALPFRVKTHNSSLFRA